MSGRSNNSMLLALLLVVMLAHQATACGNGVRIATEACDDGNVLNGDGCSSTCMIEGGCTCNAPLNGISSCDCDDDDIEELLWWALIIGGGLLLLGLCLALAYYFLSNNQGGYGGRYGPWYRSGGDASNVSPLTPGPIAPGAPPVPLREISSVPLADEDAPHKEVFVVEV